MAGDSSELVKSFDAYEVIAVITPGAVLALVLFFEVPQLRSLIGKDGLSLGDFGVFVILAYVIGHLLQAGGNFLEQVIWALFGRYSDGLRARNQRVISNGQYEKFQTAVMVMEGIPKSISDYTLIEWRSVMARAYGRVKNANRNMRIDSFNRTYGLFRGLATGLLLCCVWHVYAHGNDETTFIFILASTAALLRMQRVSFYYARTLALEFIDLNP